MEQGHWLLHSHRHHQHHRQVRSISNLKRRLLPLISRDRALPLWNSRDRALPLWTSPPTFAISAHVKQYLALIRAWLRDLTVPWEHSETHWIPRAPTSVLAGEASQVEGGALSEDLGFVLTSTADPSESNAASNCLLPILVSSTFTASNSS